MYKLELICVKYVPILIALITLIDVILYYFDIDFELINYIAGTSFLTMIPSGKQSSNDDRFIHRYSTWRLYVVSVIFNNSRYLCISSIISASKVWGKKE